MKQKLFPRVQKLICTKQKILMCIWWRVAEQKLAQNARGLENVLHAMALGVATIVVVKVTEAVENQKLTAVGVTMENAIIVPRQVQENAQCVGAME